MSSQTIGVLIGGLVPAILFGIVNVISKASAQPGMNAGVYMMYAGVGVVIAGLLLSRFQPEAASLLSSTQAYALAFGLLWGLSSGLIMFSITRFQVPMSKLVPLFNMNTLVAVSIILIVFSEWKSVNLLTLIIGAIFTVIGGTMVGLS